MLSRPSRLTPADADAPAVFVTFGCHGRRRLLARDAAKRILLGVLGQQLARTGAACTGFVVMPDHVHALLWTPPELPLAGLLQQWKRVSSWAIRRHLERDGRAYLAKVEASLRVWQRRSFAYEVHTEAKLLEKLRYMHENPVRAGLAERPTDWQFSSARFYESGESVGVRIRRPGSEGFPVAARPR